LNIPLRDDASKAPEVDEASLPPLSLSLLPILLPVVLISGASILEQVFLKQQIADSELLTFLMGLGNKNVSIVLAAGAAMLLLVRRPMMTRDRIGKSVSEALADAGVIILITSAGGAFGEVLQQCGIGGRIQELADLWNLNVLLMAWLVTVLIRTAQGSATVAMITAGGIFAGQADPATLGFHPLYLALAIGCGSKLVSWMNDSGFWVICKTSGLTEKEGLRTFTPMNIIMGIVGLIVTMIGARLFPLV
jgi:GntP family gluconate:H+ symporter